MCYDVICAYCCHKFKPNEAHFCLPRPIKRSKSVDPILYDYCLHIKGLTEAESKKEATITPVVTIDMQEVSYSSEELDKYGFVQTIIYDAGDGKKQTSDIRLCPNCHNTLTKGAGLRETKLISILGDARVGKSVYLTMLINELSTNNDMPSRLTFIGDKESKNKFYESYEKPLLNENRLVAATERRRIPPFAYNYWYQYYSEDGTIKENTVDIIFYDIAGEDMRDADTLKKNGFNIKDSNGLIYLLDPTNFTKTSDLFRVHDKALVDSVPKENSSKDVFTAMFNYFLNSENEKSKIPIAIVVSKADLFRSFSFSYFTNHPNSRILHCDETETNKGFFRVQPNLALNIEVREMLTAFGEEQILSNICSVFQNVSCFAVSSLGNPPEYKPEQGLFVNGELRPFRVKEPFYWIMAKNMLLLNFDGIHYYRSDEKVEIKLTVLQRIAVFLKSLFNSKKK